MTCEDIPGRPRIKPIETLYSQTLFRSRLEARWAIFFDTLGLSWFYEMEGFDVAGRWYLPDFWISTYQWWVEIKPPLPDEARYDPEHVRLLQGVCDATGSYGMVVYGLPGPDP